MPIFTRYLTGILDELEECTSITWPTGNKPTDKPDFPVIPYLAIGEWRPGDGFQNKLTCSGHARGTIVSKEDFIRECARVCPPLGKKITYQETEVVIREDGSKVDHVLPGQLALPF